MSVVIFYGARGRHRAVPSGGRRAKEAAGPLGTGRYASGTPSARVEGALADGIDLLSALQRLVVLFAPPWTPGERTPGAVGLGA